MDKLFVLSLVTVCILLQCDCLYSSHMYCYIVLRALSFFCVNDKEGSYSDDISGCVSLNDLLRGAG